MENLLASQPAQSSQVPSLHPRFWTNDHESSRSNHFISCGEINGKIYKRAIWVEADAYYVRNTPYQTWQDAVNATIQSMLAQAAMEEGRAA